MALCLAAVQGIPLPATLQHLLLSRLSALSESERGALQRGSVFGRNFWSGGVEALGVGQSDRLLGRLQPRGFVVRQPDSSLEGEQEWSFYHNLLREVTYESVLKRERASLHRAAMQWLEEQARQAGRLDEFAGLLGEHAERAGEKLAAADWFIRAGERSYGQGAPREAKRFFDQALELLPAVERERRWRALSGREEAAAVLGEPEAWQADIAALLLLAGELGDDGRLAESYHRQAEQARRAGDYRAVLQAADQAIVAAQRARDPGLEIKALAVKAQAQARLNLLEDAVKNAAEALARARVLGDERILALALFRAAFCYIESSDPVRAAVLQEEQIEIDRRLGNLAMVGMGSVNLGANYIQLGLFKQARAALEESRRINEALGARRALSYSLINLAWVDLVSGDLRTARELYEQVLTEAIATGDEFERAQALGELGQVKERGGDYAGAVRDITECVQIMGKLGVESIVAGASAMLARAELGQGHLEEARRWVMEAWTWLREHAGGQKALSTLTFATCADVFDALGEAEIARQVVETGYRELMRQAGKISNPEWRQSFLKNDPFNRELVEMWERMQG